MISPTAIGFFAKITLEHDYFFENIDYIELEPDSKTKLKLQKLGFLFKKKDSSNWMLFHPKETVNLKQIGSLKFNLKVLDPDFYYYTGQIANINNNTSRLLDYNKKGIWKQLEISFDDQFMTQEHLITVSIKSISKFFEFIIIPKPDSTTKFMKLIEDSGQLTFNPDQIDLFHSDQKSVFRFVSSEKIALRESYHYKISLLQTDQDGNEMILNKIPFPNSSAISVLNSEDTISSYLYF